MHTIDTKLLTAFRRELHQNPELSGKESETRKRIKGFLENYSPTSIQPIGEDSLMAIYDSGNDGPVVLFRCELDALPIVEVNDFSYKSKTEGVSHKCGHDGHMSILCGLGMHLHNQPLKKGRVILLFQSAEETGEGAIKVVKDPLFNSLNVDYAFALHNFPAFDKHAVIVREQTIMGASRGMILKFKGKTSHAAEPEKGISPQIAILKTTSLIEKKVKEQGYTDDILLTICYSHLGDRVFGISPGHAEMGITLRAFQNEDMQKLVADMEVAIQKICQEEKLGFEYEYVEVFPATVNDKKSTEKIRSVGKKLNLAIEELSPPFRASEDFSHITLAVKGAIFGLGSGKDQPALHNPDFDFPDDIIPTGVKLFSSLIEECQR